MKRHLLAGLGLGLGLLLSLSSVAAEGAPPKMAVRSLAREFVAFWDGSQGMPDAERIAAFKAQIGSQFPEFYGIGRYAGTRTQAQQDELIRGNLATFGKMRQAYLDKVARFDADLPRHIASFTAAFPDFQPTVSTYFIHSLGEMDGGTRELNGRSYLIFGADGMVRYHGAGDEAAFFHHELFHIHHAAQAKDCNDDKLADRLWTEGLATYVSKVLNPQASEQELLLDLPKGSAHLVKGKIYASLAQLEQVLDSDDRQQLTNLFLMDGRSEGGLPPRRGYMLGYLIAQELGNSRSPAQLAKLSCAEARPLMGAAIQTLKARARSQPVNAQLHMP